MPEYVSLARRVAALIEGETDPVTIMAIIVCEVHHSDVRCDWTGFYRVTAQGVLKIGPYQGDHGCHTIPFERGVCGAAARMGEVQLVEDVDSYEGHVACSASTRSEPVRSGSGEVIAVFDIDSDRPSAFTCDDVDGLGPILDHAFGRL